MREAAAEERFEDAARYRNRLHAVERLAERQAVERAVDRDDRRDRGRGRPRARRRAGLPAARAGGWSTATRSTSRTPPARSSLEVLEGFCLEYYGAAPSVPPQILVPRGLGDTSTLAAFLSELRGSRVEVRAPERGEKRRLQELAQQNAELALSSETFVAETKRLRRVEALEELREVLNLESLPIRIECFDISNIQGQEIVGSMVVFEDGVAKKAHYRKFAVRGPTGRTTSPRWPRSSRAASRGSRAGPGRRRLRRVVRGHAEPRRDRRRQGPARRGARGDAGATTCRASRSISLAKRVEEVFLPGRAAADPAARPLARAAAAAAASATRRTASRSPSTASAATPLRASRCSTSSRASARRAGGRCSRTSARPSGCSRRPRGARGRPRRAGEDGAEDLRAAAPGRTRLSPPP